MENKVVTFLLGVYVSSKTPRGLERPGTLNSHSPRHLLSNVTGDKPHPRVVGRRHLQVMGGPVQADDVQGNAGVLTPGLEDERTGREASLRPGRSRACVVSGHRLRACSSELRSKAC